MGSTCRLIAVTQLICGAIIAVSSTADAVVTALTFPRSNYRVRENLGIGFAKEEDL